MSILYHNTFYKIIHIYLNLILKKIIFFFFHTDALKSWLGENKPRMRVRNFTRPAEAPEKVPQRRNYSLREPFENFESFWLARESSSILFSIDVELPPPYQMVNFI